MRTSELKRRLKKFFRSNPRTNSVEELSIELGGIVQPFLTMLIGATFDTIYRGRIHNDSSTYFTNMSELWYPPITKVNRLGRFNDIGESIFYAAGNHSVVAQECLMKDQEVISIVTCKKITPDPLRVANMFTDKFKKNSGISVTAKTINTSQQAYDILKTKRNVKKHRVIQNFLESLALRSVSIGEEYNYKFSICAKNLFYTIPELDGLCYPSIKLDHRDVNFALRPEVADKHYKAVQVTVLRYDAKSDYLICINKSVAIDDESGFITYEI
ncbi:RES domain-containing protein [uncultured Anaeromusa sp.]|uniref:RES domain-containing protein n=1 Tax=uncultured Anaeromusa sp. TaxID=673273 RepID=UPI0029C7AB90|nr:RES domain-containing protein [uncultured Anaeromusa sp.]